MAYNPYTTGLDLNRSNTIASNPFIADMGLSPEELGRVQNELNFWKWYKGHHWNTKRPDGEPQVTANYTKAFVDKGVAFLAGKGFSINTDPNAEAVTKPFLDYVWDDNNRELLFIEMAQMGGVTGQVFIKVAVEEYDPVEEPDKYEMYPNGRIRLILLPSTCVFPRFDAHDREKIVEVSIVYKILVDEDGKLKEYWYREHITPKTITEYIGDRVINRRENARRCIPIIHIKNIPISGEPFGQSDIKDLTPLNEELNEKLTDISDIINYHSAPITVIKGARASKLERGARKVWGGLPKESDVFNLELKSDLSAALNYVGILKTAMFEIGKIPENALGAKKAISNTSGVALHIENQPLMELTRIKWATYGKGIQEINRMILRLASEMGLDAREFDVEKFKALSVRERYATYTEFKDPLPKDELIQMQLIAQKIALNLQTRIDALKELGEYNAYEKLEQIKQELIEWNDLLMEAGLAMSETQGGANRSLQTNVGGEVLRGEQSAPDNKRED